jgi:hypothetical protein
MRTYPLRRVAPLWVVRVLPCLDAKTRGLAFGALASATCNNFIADLLVLSEVSHSLLVAGPPCVHPYLGKWALHLGAQRILNHKLTERISSKAQGASPWLPENYRWQLQW